MLCFNFGDCDAAVKPAQMVDSHTLVRVRFGVTELLYHVDEYVQVGLLTFDCLDRPGHSVDTVQIALLGILKNLECGIVRKGVDVREGGVSQEEEPTQEGEVDRWFLLEICVVHE